MVADQLDETRLTISSIRLRDSEYKQKCNPPNEYTSSIRVQQYGLGILVINEMDEGIGNRSKNRWYNCPIDRTSVHAEEQIETEDSFAILDHS